LSTYSGYRKRMEKLTGKKIAEDSRAIAGLNSFIAKIRKNGKAFLEGFTSLYSSNSIIPWVKKELEHLEISVPEDISYISFNPSSSLFFDGLEPDYIDKNSPYRREISKWLKLKLIDCKPRNETFRKNAGANVVPGQTVRNLKKGGSK
jgi:hypothetical protein